MGLSSSRSTLFLSVVLATAWSAHAHAEQGAPSMVQGAQVDSILNQCRAVIQKKGSDVRHRNIIQEIQGSCRPESVNVLNPQSSQALKAMVNGLEDYDVRIADQVYQDILHADLVRTSISIWAFQAKFVGRPPASESEATRMVCDQVGLAICKKAPFAGLISNSYQKFKVQLNTKPIEPFSKQEAAQIQDFNQRIDHINAKCADLRRERQAALHEVELKMFQRNLPDASRLAPRPLSGFKAPTAPQGGGTVKSEPVIGVEELKSKSFLSSFLLMDSFRESIGNLNSPCKKPLSHASKATVDEAVKEYGTRTKDSLSSIKWRIREAEGRGFALEDEKARILEYLKSDPALIGKILQAHSNSNAAKLVCDLTRDLYASDATMKSVENVLQGAALLGATILALSGVGSVVDVAVFEAVEVGTTVVGAVSMASAGSQYIELSFEERELKNKAVSGNHSSEELANRAEKVEKLEEEKHNARNSFLIGAVTMSSGSLIKNAPRLVKSVNKVLKAGRATKREVNLVIKGGEISEGGIVLVKDIQKMLKRVKEAAERTHQAHTTTEFADHLGESHMASWAQLDDDHLAKSGLIYQKLKDEEEKTTFATKLATLPAKEVNHLIDEKYEQIEGLAGSR